jgi:hypothetical protein
MTTTPTPSGPTLSGDGVDAARELADALVEALGVESATRIAKALDAHVGDLHERVEALLQRSEAAFERLKSGRLGLDDPAQPLEDSLLTPDALDDHLAGVDVARHGSEGKGSMGSASVDPTETRTTGPFPTLTDHLEDLIRVDEILAREFPRTPSRERIRVAVEITGALKCGAL